MDAYSARLMEYENYLVANRLVNRDKVKYYSNWADKFLYGINYREEAIKQNSFISFVMGWGDIEGEELHTAQGQQHGL